MILLLCRLQNLTHLLPTCEPPPQLDLYAAMDRYGVLHPILESGIEIQCT